MFDVSGTRRTADSLCEHAPNIDWYLLRLPSLHNIGHKGMVIAVMTMTMVITRV